MREILFRGKAINRDNGNHRTDYKNGDWVYGLVTKLYDERFENLPAEMTDINGVSGIEIDYKTISQSTGLTDKNGTRIFEGDIVTLPAYQGGKKKSIVYFKNGKFAVDGSNYSFKDIAPKRMEVIGNIHDNPELLKGGVDNA